MNISFSDVQINRSPPPPLHQSRDSLKVSELEEQIVNEYHAAEMHILKWYCEYSWPKCNSSQECDCELFRHGCSWPVQTEKRSSSVSDNVDNLSDMYIATNQAWTPSLIEVIGPSLPLKSDMDAPFKPPALLLAGLIPPPQRWMRGIRNTSICMADYLQRESQVSACPAFWKYW